LPVHPDHDHGISLSPYALGAERRHGARVSAFPAEHSGLKIREQQLMEPVGRGILLLHAIIIHQTMFVAIGIIEQFCLKVMPFFFMGGGST
jgi:hypothetical protein